jgi:ABC-type polysaccharide/polyol phosphate export permease
MTALLAEFREMVREQAEHRELLYQMIKRDLLLRYKQTVMGFGWAVFNPLLNTIIFSVIFMRVAPIETGVPYPLFAYCGLWVWNFFASSLKFAVNSLTSNTNLITKVYFPREVFPLSTVIVSFVDFLVAAVVLVAMMAYYGVAPGVSILLLPAIMAVHVALTIATALVLAMSNLFYRDVKYLFEVVVVVWMFISSVLYPIELVGGRVGALMRLNPMTPIIDAYRDVLLRGEWPPVAPLANVAVFSVVFLAVAWLMFHRSEFRFAENV